MFERDITHQDIRVVLESGEVIEEYPDDKPYPGRLMLGWTGMRPIHGVAAEIAEVAETIVITAYEPDSDLWEPGFRNRREP